MKAEFELNSLDKIKDVATKILTTFPSHRTYTLVGDLGAGKTTLIQAFCSYLNVIDEVVSPTYTLINEYATKDGETVYHSDLYRIESTNEAIDTGIEDYMFSNSYCFIEWPQIIEPILPNKFVNLEIEIVSNEKRKIIAKSYG